MDQPQKEGSPPNAWLITATLALVCLLVRASHLMALPIFSDEAIYLRWAQLIRDGHPWISLIDPKPPLHFWLLATVFNWTSDPLRAARLLSVLAGVLSVPAIMAAASEIARLARTTTTSLISGRTLGILAALLLIFCPFVSFYQRFATADALFLLEMLTAIYLSLRWARTSSAKNSWLLTLATGAILGLALLTRQGLSYTLFGIPFIALALNLPRTTGKILLQKIFQLATILFIAALLWLPYLTAELGKYTTEAQAEAKLPSDANEWTVIKRRILYQDQFTQSGESRIDVALRNAAKTFLPEFFEPAKTGDSRGTIGALKGETGWLSGYLTPPIYALSIIGLIWLALRRQWPILAFLACWMLFMLAPVIILGNVIYSRYILAGAVVFLLPAAWILTEILTWTMTQKTPWLLTILILAAVLFLPLHDIGTQVSRWWQQPLTTQDKYQYLTGWSAGLAVQKALQDLPQTTPITVITDGGWGLPADALWVYLSNRPNIHIYYTSVSATQPILLPAAEPNTYMLRKDKYLYTPAEPVLIEKGTPIYFFTSATQNRSDSTEKILYPGITPDADKVARFSVK